MAVHYAREFYEFTKSYQRKTKGIIQKDLQFILLSG